MGQMEGRGRALGHTQALEVPPKRGVGQKRQKHRKRGEIRFEATYRPRELRSPLATRS